MADGEAWKARIEAGETIEVYFKQLQTIENRKTWNVIAETKGGDADNVLVLGAHLDSVQAGPGINDDGSGTTLILELLEAIQKYNIPRDDLKLRFIWWAAEENGLFGSEHYVGTATAEELAKIRAYLNFDMVGRGFYGVFDGDGSAFNLSGAAGSDVIEKLFTTYLTKTAKVTVTETELDGGSDYVPFMEKGIPIGGLFTGVGVEQDACYHQACDTYGES